MHEISSINIKPIKLNSEIHNQRIGTKLDYVFYKRTHLNKSIITINVNEYRTYIKHLVKTKTGRKMQKSATPIREGVLNLSKNAKMKDLTVLADKLESSFGIKTMQIYIHEDEGRIENGDFIQNRHAHMVFGWVNESTGKSLRLKPIDMIEMQNIVAETLHMKRGVSSNKKHLSALQYKNQQEEKKLKSLQEELNETEVDLKDATVDLDRIKTQTKKVKRNEQIKSASLNLLESVSGVKNLKIEQLKKQVSDSHKEFIKISSDNETLVDQVNGIREKYHSLSQNHSELSMRYLKLEELNRQNLMHIEIERRAQNKRTKYINKVLEDNANLRTLLVKGLIEKDTQAQKKLMQITHDFNKEKQHRNRGISFG